MDDFVLGLVVACAGLIHTLIFLRMPDGEMVQRIPDDAFYYMVAARNFAAQGRWTFDGVEPASGFHLLWGYLLAAFFRVVPHASLHLVFAVGSTLQSACLGIAAFLLARTATRLFGQHAWVGVAIVFLSASCLQQATWLMEGSLVIAAAAAVISLLSRTSSTLRPALCVGAAALGFALMMARSDAGLLPLIFLVAHLLLWRAGKAAKSMSQLAGLVLAGSVSGLIVVFLHTHWISGHWIQASAEQKAFWTKISGRSLDVGRSLVFTFFNFTLDATAPYTTSVWAHRFPKLLNSVVRLGLVVAILWATIQTAWQTSKPLVRVMLWAMLSVILAYIVFYAFDSAAVQRWYIANFTGPVAIMAGAAAAYFAKRARILVYAVALFLCVAGFSFSLRATTPWQEAMYRSGIFLRDHPDIRPVASFNAGIISFFEGGTVVNADGLMNDSILPYAKQGQLARYFAERHIRYLLESPQIFDRNMALRGGYADGKLQGCIRSATDLFPHDPDNIYGDDHIRLYQFDDGCLTSAYSSPAPAVTEAVHRRP